MTPLSIFLLLLALGLAAALWVAFARWQRDIARHRSRVTELGEAHKRELDQAREDRNRLLDALNDAFLLVDDGGRIHFANEAAHHVLHSRKLLDRTMRDVFVDPRLAQALTSGLESGKPMQTRISLPQQASPLRELEKRGVNSWIIDVAPLPVSGDLPPLHRIIIRDITAECQTDQIRKDFVANASHELRTPMAIIHGYLENLLDDQTLLDDRQMTLRFLTVMLKHSDRMSRIIEDMLVISRLESGEDNSSLNIEPFSLKACLQDTLDRLEALIRNQQARIVMELENEATQIQGDRFYWTQALFNLIENALKQNPRPGLTIRIGCREEGDRQQIWISDDGIGIPSADLPFIFRRFYRVDKQHSQSEIKGTGLGLSIVKRAIEAHQGTITASSTPGAETKFLITVPRSGPEFKVLPVEPPNGSGIG